MRSRRWLATSWVAKAAAAALCFVIPTLSVLLLSPGAHEVDVTPGSIDFGKLEWGQKSESKVQITNQGSGVLKISRITSSCGCAGATLTESVLNPGDSATLSVKYEARGGLGVRREYVDIYSSATQRRALRIPIVAVVCDIAGVEPSVVDFGIAEEASLPITRTVVLTSPSISLDTLVSVSRTCKPFFSVSINTGNTHTERIITVTLNAAGNIGPVDGEVLIAWRGDKPGVISIPIRAFVSGPAGVTPKHILLTRSRTTVSGVINGNVSIDGPVIVDKSIDTLIEVSVEGTTPNWTIKVTRKPAIDGPRHASGVIQIPVRSTSSDDAKMYRLRVPLSVIAQ
jgi:hypothetical protein